MGAKITISTKFTGEESRNMNKEDVENCNSKSLQVNAGMGPSIGTSSSKCKAFTNNVADGSGKTTQRQFISTFGSLPKANLQEWANQAFESPLPIKMSLSPILNLFKPEILSNARLGFTPNIPAMLKLVGTRYWNYCENNKDKIKGSVKTCKPEVMKGCGWNDNCERLKQSCINDNSRPEGYRCCSDPCRNNPCRNGGRCTSNMGTCQFTCACATTWSGSTCSTRVVVKSVLEREVKAETAKYDRDTLRNHLGSILPRNYPGYRFSVNVMNGGGSNNDNWKVYCGDCSNVIQIVNYFGKNVFIAWGKYGSDDFSGTSSWDSLANSVKNIGCHANTPAKRAWDNYNRYGLSFVLVVRFGNGLRYSSNGGGGFNNYECGDTYTTGWWSSKRTHKHKNSVVAFYGKRNYKG